MITFTKLSLRFKWTTIALAVVVMVAGVWGFTQLKQEIMPNIEFPVASAMVRWPGHSSEEVLENVTIPLEDAAERVPGMVQVQSVSSAGFALVVVQTDFGYSGEEISANLQAEVEQVVLPPDVEPSEILELGLGEMPVIESAASSDMPLDELQALVEEKILPELQKIEGVGDIELSGGIELEAPPPGVDLPSSWVLAGKMGGFELETTSDLEPVVIQGVVAQRPEMLDDLTPEMLLALAPEAAAALPQDYLAGLDADLQSQLAALAAQAQAQAADSPPLPAQWQAQGMMTAADLTSSVIGTALKMDPQSLDELSDEVLMALSPQAAAALPSSVLENRDQAVVSAVLALVAEAAPEATANRTNGLPSVGIGVLKTRDANTIGVVHAVEKRLEELEGELSGVHFDTVFEQASFIEESIAGVSREGLLGAFFAVIVIFVFLNFSGRSTLVTAVSIPLSVMAGFAIMKMFNLTLNMMTLGGMTVAVGRVVDDSIVVLENIYRHIQRGEDRRMAVIQGTRDVARAIFASTLTTVGVFLPLGLLGGLVSEVFLPFALTVTFALAASFVVAITIVPLLAYLFIRPEHLKPEKETWMQRLYTPLLKWSLAHRATTLVVAFALLLGSVALINWIPLSFIPAIGETTLEITLDLPSGTTMVETDRVTRQIETFLAGRDDVKIFNTVVGSSGESSLLMGGGGVDPRQANISVVPANGNLEQLTEETRAYVESLVGAEFCFVTSQDMASGAMGGFDVVLAADNYEDLAVANQKALEVLKQQEHLVNVSSDLPAAEPGQSLALISRIDGQLALSFSAEVTSKDLMRINDNASQAVSDIPDLPAGVKVLQGFGTQQQAMAFADMGQSMVVAVVVVYLVMALAFRNAVHPFTILFSLPLAAIGAMAALFITGNVLGISSLIGMLMLIGIVVTNAIVLIERVQQNRSERGLDAYDALIEAGRTRLRPIWMTAIAAILALIPLALGLTEGAIIAAELATVVIGGLLTSTFLTLVVVPVVYSLLDQFRGWLTRRINRRKLAVAD
jgi:HAE1 family hydrophobic/amphiphilic exporter-1